MTSSTTDTIRRGPMAAVKQLKRVHWAIVKKLGWGSDARHACYREVCGKTSLSDLDRDELDAVVAHLQRLTGQHRDGFAHVRTPEGRQHWDATEPGEMATYAQREEIRRLSDEFHKQVGWRSARGLEYLIRKRVLVGIKKQRWDALTTTLTRDEATRTISILADMVNDE